MGLFDDLKPVTEPQQSMFSDLSQQPYSNPTQSTELVQKVWGLAKVKHNENDWEMPPIEERYSFDNLPKNLTQEDFPISTFNRADTSKFGDYGKYGKVNANLARKYGYQLYAPDQETLVGRAFKQTWNNAVVKVLETLSTDKNTASIALTQHIEDLEKSDPNILTDPKWSGYKEQAEKQSKKWLITFGDRDEQIKYRMYYLRAQDIERSKLPTAEVEPATKVSQKVVDIGTGVGGMIAQIAVLKKTMGISDLLAWELQAQATGSAPGEGAMMYLAYSAPGTAMSKWTPEAKLAKFAKESIQVSSEMGLMGGTTALEGGNTEDILLASLVPLGFKASHLAHNVLFPETTYLNKKQMEKEFSNRKVYETGYVQEKSENFAINDPFAILKETPTKTVVATKQDKGVVATIKEERPSVAFPDVEAKKADKQDKDYTNITTPRQKALEEDAKILGLDSADSKEKQTFKGWEQDAIRLGVPERALEIAADAIERRVGLGAIDKAGVTIRYANAKVEMRRIKQELKTTTNPEERNILLSNFGKSLDEANLLKKALYISGSETGRMLVSQKLEIDELDLPTILVLGEKNKGSKLSDKESKDFSAKSDELDIASAKVEKVSQKIKTETAMDIVKKGAKKRFKNMTDTELKSNRAELEAKLKKLLEGGCY